MVFFSLIDVILIRRHKAPLGDLFRECYCLTVLYKLFYGLFFL